MLVLLFQTKENMYLHVCGKAAVISSSSLPPF